MILDIIAAYLGYKRWGGWQGALRGVLTLWLIYFVIFAVFYVILFLTGPSIEQILIDVGESV